MADNIQKSTLISIQTDTSQVAQAAKEVKGLKDNLNDVNNTPIDKPFKTLKQELREATNELQKLANSGIDKTSEQFRNAAIRVANLKDEIAETNATVNAFNPDNKLQGLVSLAQGATGVIQGVAGAMAFLGVESDTAAQTIARLQGLMAFSDALNSIDDIKTSFANFSNVITQTTVFQKANAVATNMATGAMRLLGISANTTSTAFKVLKGAIAATGIGLLVVAIGTLLPMIMDWVSGTNDAEAAQKRLNTALEAQRDLLSQDMKALDYATKMRVARAKIAGATEADIKKIEEDGAKERLSLLEQNYKRLDEIAADSKGRSVEDQTKANEAANTAYREYLNGLSDAEVRRLETQATIAEEGRKKQKEATDKAEQDKKAAFDKAEAQRKQEYEAIQNAWKDIVKLDTEANRERAQLYMTEREKELDTLKNNHADQIAELGKAKQRELDYIAKNGGDKQDVLNRFGKVEEDISKLYNERRLDIEKKYRQLITDYISESSKSAYQQALDDENKRYEEALKSAATFGQRLAVIGKHLQNVENIEATETSRVNTINAETNLINTQVDNQVNPEDDVQTRLSKLQSVYEAEKQLRAAQKAEELLQAENDEAAKNNIIAKYRQMDKDAEAQNSEDKKAIWAAETEAKVAMYDTISNAANVMADLVGKNTVAGKALAVAATTIDTYLAAQKAYASQMSVPSPDAPVRATIAAAAAVLQGLARVKAIVAVKVPGKGGQGSAGGSNVSAPTPTAPQINSTMLNADQIKVQDVRVTNEAALVTKTYVVEKELNDKRKMADLIDKMSSWG